LSAEKVSKEQSPSDIARELAELFEDDTFRSSVRLLKVIFTFAQ